MDAPVAPVRNTIASAPPNGVTLFSEIKLRKLGKAGCCRTSSSSSWASGTKGGLRAAASIFLPMFTAPRSIVCSSFSSNSRATKNRDLYSHFATLPSRLLNTVTHDVFMIRIVFIRKVLLRGIHMGTAQLYTWGEDSQQNSQETWKIEESGLDAFQQALEPISTFVHWEILV